MVPETGLGLQEYAASRPGPRILLFDIETTPMLTWNWRPYKADALATHRYSHLLCFAFQWWGDGDEVGFSALWHDLDFEPWTENDRYLADHLWQLFDRADAICAHNSDRFDRKRVNALFNRHRLIPPSPYKSIDTLKEWRRYFGEDSYRLNELSKRYDGTAKLPHQGIHTWLGAMAGDGDEQARMEAYNRHDVVLLRDRYEQLVPWMGSPGHAQPVNHGHWSPDRAVCPKCGDDRLVPLKAAPYRTAVNEYRTFRCVRCGGVSRDRTRIPQNLDLDPKLR